MSYHLCSVTAVCMNIWTYEFHVRHVWMSHVSCKIESCLTYEWVMSHTHMNIWTYESHVRHVWMSHDSRMDESCLTYEWVDVMSHCSMYEHMNIRISRTSRLNESCLTYGWVMSRVWMSHVSHTYVWAAISALQSHCSIYQHMNI